MKKKNEAPTRMARSASWIGVAGVVGALISACSGGSSTGGLADGGTGSSGGSGTSATNGDTGDHSGTSGGASGVNPTGSAPGEACNVPADCLIVYCDCANGSLVNAQRCIDHACQTAKAGCPAACMGFGTRWSGTASVEKPRTSGSSSGTSGSSSSSGASSSSGSSGSTCASFADCPSYTCTCIDNQTVSDQACIDGVCASAATGCDRTCVNTGHGGA